MNTSYVYLDRRALRRLAAALTAVALAATVLALGLSSGRRADAGTCLTAADLHTAAVRGDTATARLVVDWAAGTADYVTNAPLCQTMYGTGALNAYWINAHTFAGHGPARWPQSRQAFTPSQPLSLAAGHHVFRVPADSSQCDQRDAAVEDRPVAWPAVQPRPGTPQPRTRYYVPGTPGEYVGNGTGCFNRPTVTTRVECPTCTPNGAVGPAYVTFVITNRAVFAQIRVVPSLIRGSTVIRPPAVLVRAGQTATVRVRVLDGDRYNLAWQVGYGVWTPLVRLTGDGTVLCPPAPQVTVTLTCDCGAVVRGGVVDRSTGRYVHVVTVTVNGAPRVFRVASRTSGSLPLAFPRGSTVVVTVQNQLPGHNVGAPVRVASVTAS